MQRGRREWRRCPSPSGSADVGSETPALRDSVARAPGREAHRRRRDGRRERPGMPLPAGSAVSPSTATIGPRCSKSCPWRPRCTRSRGCLSADPGVLTRALPHPPQQRRAVGAEDQFVEGGYVCEVLLAIGRTPSGTAGARAGSDALKAIDLALFGKPRVGTGCPADVASSRTRGMSDNSASEWSSNRVPMPRPRTAGSTSTMPIQPNRAPYRTVATVPTTCPRARQRTAVGLSARNCSQSRRTWFQPLTRHSRRPTSMSGARIDRQPTA